MKVLKKILDKTAFKNKLPSNLNNSDQWLFQTHVDTYIPEVKIYSGKNILFLPEHIIIDGFKMWEEEVTNRSLYITKNLLKLRFIFKIIRNYFSRRTIKLKGKYVLVTDDWSWSYFHWTADVLQKLYLIRNELNDYVVLIPEHFKKYSYITESLALFNAEIYFFSPRKNLRIEELIIPSPVGWGLFNYDVINGLSSYIKHHNKITSASLPVHPKIYISRGKAPKRKILNEDEVISILKQFKFEIFYMEDIDFIDQIKLVSNCKYLVSLHGAGLTNELYLPSSANVLEIRHPKDNLNNCYYLLATALHLNYLYFLGDSDEEDPHYANISINVSSFHESISKFLLN